MGLFPSKEDRDKPVDPTLIGWNVAESVLFPVYLLGLPLIFWATINSIKNNPDASFVFYILLVVLAFRALRAWEDEVNLRKLKRYRKQQLI